MRRLLQITTVQRNNTFLVAPFLDVLKTLKLLFIISFIAQFFQMKNHFFSTTFEASMKMFYVEAILEFLTRFYLALLPLTIQKIYLF